MLKKVRHSSTKLFLFDSSSTTEENLRASTKTISPTETEFWLLSTELCSSETLRTESLTAPEKWFQTMDNLFVKDNGSRESSKKNLKSFELSGVINKSIVKFFKAHIKIVWKFPIKPKNTMTYKNAENDSRKKCRKCKKSTYSKM